MMADRALYLQRPQLRSSVAGCSEGYASRLCVRLLRDESVRRCGDTIFAAGVLLICIFYGLHRTGFTSSVLSGSHCQRQATFSSSMSLWESQLALSIF